MDPLTLLQILERLELLEDQLAEVRHRLRALEQGAPESRPGSEPVAAPEAALPKPPLPEQDQPSVSTPVPPPLPVAPALATPVALPESRPQRVKPY
jgi:hypothetical protein